MYDVVSLCQVLNQCTVKFLSIEKLGSHRQIDIPTKIREIKRIKIAKLFWWHFGFSVKIFMLHFIWNALKSSSTLQNHIKNSVAVFIFGKKFETMKRHVIIVKLETIKMEVIRSRNMRWWEIAWETERTKVREKIIRWERGSTRFC